MADSTVDDKFKPVLAHEVDDLALLPGQFRSFAAEVRLGFDLMNQRLLPLLERLESKLDDVTVRVSRLERDRDDHDKRLRALEAQAKTKRIQRRK